jgi:hypothetical protein
MLKILRPCLERLRRAPGGSGLHSYSSWLLSHRSGYRHVCSGLRTEIEFGEVKIRV